MVNSTATLQMNTLNSDVVNVRLTLMSNNFFPEVIDTANGLVKEIGYYRIVNGQPLSAPPYIKSYGTLLSDKGRVLN